MVETIQSFLDRVKTAATVLEDSATLELIAAVTEHTRATHLRILIVGSTGAGRFSITNTLLEQPSLLPVSNIPKVPISVHLGYGEAITIQVFGRDGISKTLPADKLRSFLTDHDTDATK